MIIGTKTPKYKRGRWHQLVKLDKPEIGWQDGCFTFTQPNLKDRHDYQVTITLEEFRRMLAVFAKE